MNWPFHRWHQAVSSPGTPGIQLTGCTSSRIAKRQAAASATDCCVSSIRMIGEKICAQTVQEIERVWWSCEEGVVVL